MKLHEIKKEINTIENHQTLLFSDAFGIFWYDANDGVGVEDMPEKQKKEYKRMDKALVYLRKLYFAKMEEYIKGK